MAIDTCDVNSQNFESMGNRKELSLDIIDRLHPGWKLLGSSDTMNAVCRADLGSSQFLLSTR